MSKEIFAFEMPIGSIGDFAGLRVKRESETLWRDMNNPGEVWTADENYRPHFMVVLEEK